MKKENGVVKAKKTNAEKVGHKTSMVSIRLESYAESVLREEAGRLGIPYQTLIKSILHRFITGDLVDKKSDEE